MRARPLPTVLHLALTAAFLPTIGTTAPLAAQDADRDAVVAVIEDFHAALAAGDSSRALRHLSEDVVVLESGGLEDKSHYRSGHLAGDMRFAAAVPRQRGEISVTVRGDVAWAHSTSVTQGTMGDREVNSQGAELVVLARDGGTWRIQAIHWSSRQRREPGELSILLRGPGWGW